MPASRIVSHDDERPNEDGDAPAIVTTAAAAVLQGAPAPSLPKPALGVRDACGGEVEVGWK